MMTKRWILHGLLAGLLVSQVSCASWMGKKHKAIPLRKSLTRTQTELLLKDVDTLQKQVDAGQKRAARSSINAIMAQYPQIAQYELKDFVKAEKYLLKGKFSRSAKVYQKVLEDYPESELRMPSVERLFKIGTAYVVDGRKKVLLGLFMISGDETGIKILEIVSEAEGLEDPNGLGLKCAMIIVDNYEKRKLYEDAYLKWLEISTVWEDGELGRQALLGMADSKRASYNVNPPERRHLFDGSSLKAAKTYYEKYLTLFPDDAKEQYVTDAVHEINEQIAYKEYSVAQFYDRTGQKQAATIYYNMVIETWPQSEAAQMARETLNQPEN
ncbi:MAG: outer membrane protein assembly factor BamD [Phycisphaerae bacterium]|nr:outer membrane protein assembly factor BamD [Phycisphaerae bacterium]